MAFLPSDVVDPSPTATSATLQPVTVVGASTDATYAFAVVVFLLSALLAVAIAQLLRARS